jgi:hypothetical protein
MRLTSEIERPLPFCLLSLMHLAAVPQIVPPTGRYCAPLSDTLVFDAKSSARRKYKQYQEIARAGMVALPGIEPGFED